MGVQVGWVKEQLRAQKCGILELVRHRQVIYEPDFELAPAVECKANAAIFSDAGACRAVHGVSWWILANAVNPTLRSLPASTGIERRKRWIRPGFSDHQQIEYA